MLQRVLALALLLTMTGCAGNLKNQTPQYQAAVTINSFTTGLRAFQDSEVAVAHDTNLIPPALHVSIEKDVRKAYEYDALAETAAKSGDLTSSQGYYRAALAVLSELDPALVGIKNPQKQQELKTLLEVAIAIAQQFSGGAQ